MKSRRTTNSKSLVKPSPGAGQSAGGSAPERVGYARDHHRRISSVGARAHSCPFWPWLATRGRCAWGGGARACGYRASPAWSRSPATWLIPTSSPACGCGRGADRPPRQQRQRARPESAAPFGPILRQGLRSVFEANVFAPLALVQLPLPRFAPGARIVNLVSDAACRGVRALGWVWLVEGGSRTDRGELGPEHPGLRVYAVDPGDMRTQMQQDAFPGEDISDRPRRRRASRAS